MSSNLISQFPKLEIVAQAKSAKARKLLLKEFSRDPRFFKAVRELVKNTVKKTIKLKDAEKKKLKKYSNVLQAIMKKKTSNKRKEKLMCQTGTGVFIPLVLPIVSTLLAELLSHRNAVR